MSTFLRAFLSTFCLEHFFEYFFERPKKNFFPWALFWALFWELFFYFLVFVSYLRLLVQAYYNFDIPYLRFFFKDFRSTDLEEWRSWHWTIHKRMFMRETNRYCLQFDVHCEWFIISHQTTGNKLHPHLSLSLPKNV